jgi:predicted transposase/invertase (TIGR01784 family)
MSDISPKIDIAFKKLFGVEENKDLLISLINSIVNKKDRIAEVTLLNPYNPQNFKDDKLSILDIKARGENGKLYNIEIQITDEADYDKRALYYWSKLYTDQLKVGADYSSLSKAIGIHILNFLSIPESEKYHNIFRVTEQDTGIEYFKDLELHTIELRKFTSDPKEELSDIVAKVKNSLDRWVAFLTRYDLLRVGKLPEELADPSLEKAISVLEVMNFSDKERELYEAQRKWMMIEANTVKKYFEKGKEEGREEGREEEKKATALKMLGKGASLDFISEITGISVPELLALQLKLKINN